MPDCDRCVLIAAPHTSSFDLVYMLASILAFARPVHWVAQPSVFRGPARRPMQAIGGIVLERGGPRGAVECLAEEFERRERLVLAIAPEGNSLRADYWQSGFYRIAERARVPLLPGVLDFATRRASVGPLIEVTGDLRADMDRVRAVYAGVRGRIPGRFGPIRLREEEPDSPAGAQEIDSPTSASRG